MKKGADLTVFSNANYPSYMKGIVVKKRTTTMSSSVARRSGELVKYEQETKAWLLELYQLEIFTGEGGQVSCRVSKSQWA